MDRDQDSYITLHEFLEGFFSIYCSTFDEKTKFIFQIYDFDNDGFITKDDIATILNSLPLINNKLGG